MLHTGYGVGALICPLICTPFLAIITYETGDKNTDSEFTVVKESRANVAFAIIGTFTLFVAALFYVFHFTNVKPHLVDESQSEALLVKSDTKLSSCMNAINPASYAEGNFSFGLCVYILLAVYYFCLLGGETLYNNLVRTIAVDRFKFDKAQASYLNSGFWVSLTIGRLIWSVIARYVSVQKLILFQSLVHLGSVTAITMYALRSARLLWCLTLLEGLLVSPLYPLGIAYGDSQITMAGFCLMIVALSGSFGDMTYMWVGGKMYDVYGPEAVVAVSNIAGAVLAVAVVVFRCSSRSLKAKL